MTQRLEYIDSLRGIAMLMVVFCHCTFFSLGMQENTGWVTAVFSAIMLPIFFFVSGIFAPFILRIFQLRNRGLKVLIPTVSLFFLYVYVCKSNPMHCIEEEYKHGYWFTLSLFMMNIIHYGVSNLCSRWKDVRILITLIIASICLIAFKNWDWHSNGAFLCNWLSLRLLAEHFPYYILGMCAKRYWEQYHRVIKNKWLMAFALIAFVVLFNFNRGGMYKAMVVGILGCILSYRICFANQQILSSSTFIGKHLVMIGRYTLPIYLVHYFFFLGMKLPEIGAQLAGSAQHWWLTSITCIILSIIITYSSLLTVKLLESISPEMMKFVLGK